MLVQSAQGLVMMKVKDWVKHYAIYNRYYGVHTNIIRPFNI